MKKDVFFSHLIHNFNNILNAYCLTMVNYQKKVYEDDEDEEEDYYESDDKSPSDRLDDDEISPEEEGFINGYEEDMDYEEDE